MILSQHHDDEVLRIIVVAMLRKCTVGIVDGRVLNFNVLKHISNFASKLFHTYVAFFCGMHHFFCFVRSRYSRLRVVVVRRTDWHCHI
jgi:hypothetical protein